MTTPAAGVIIDHGGVLTTPVLEAISASVEAHGGDPTEVWADWLGDEGAQTALEGYEAGQVSLESFVTTSRRAHELLGTVLDPRADGFFGRRLGCADAMWAVTAALCERGIPAALVSNTPRDWVAALEHTIPPRSQFLAEHFSWRTGRRKPDPHVLLSAAESLGLAPDAVIVVDDSGTTIDTASRLGFATIHVTDPTAAAHELGRRLDVTPPGDRVGSAPKVEGAS